MEGVQRGAFDQRARCSRRSGTFCQRPVSQFWSSIVAGNEGHYRSAGHCTSDGKLPSGDGR
eukprot:5815193-Prorocentrum_lima.AAC.1